MLPLIWIISHFPQSWKFPLFTPNSYFVDIRHRAQKCSMIQVVHRWIRLLVKPVKSAISYMPTVSYELPYEGAKEMLLVDEVDNKEFLTGLFNAMYEELPTPKSKKKK